MSEAIGQPMSAEADYLSSRALSDAAEALVAQKDALEKLIRGLSQRNEALEYQGDTIAKEVGSLEQTVTVAAAMLGGMGFAGYTVRDVQYLYSFCFCYSYLSLPLPLTFSFFFSFSNIFNHFNHRGFFNVNDIHR